MDLQVKGNRIVDGQGRLVQLRGTCIGGWMNMENFINGYPGVESGVRAALADVLGPARAQFFFERWLDHFLAEEDIAFIKSTGANIVRLALNYRHFENDAAPFQHNEAGFTRLAQAIEWCARHELYVILEMHAVQGWQNPDWHSDNANAPALFWQHPHFQDRYIALWEELARRYKGNPTIAGYDVMNEPQTKPLHGEPRWDMINRVYRRVVNAIRAIDSDHIIFLEGDGFAGRFNCLEAPFAPNLVYSGHSYSPACFGPGPYPGTLNGKYWDHTYMRESNHRHQAFHYALQHDVPLWIGEFGTIHSGPADELDCRLRALDDQLDVFEDFGAQWTTWTYKDVGVMGWVTLDQESEYMQRVAPVMKAKAELDADAWMDWLPTTPPKELVRNLAGLIEEAICDPDIKHDENLHYLKRAVFSGYTATIMESTWAKRFKGMSEVELDRMLESFAFKNCRPREDLLGVVKKHMAKVGFGL